MRSLCQDDGLYRVSYKGICAAFVVKNGQVTKCAPVLRSKISFWKTIAEKVVPRVNPAANPSDPSRPALGNESLPPSGEPAHPVP